MRGAFGSALSVDATRSRPVMVGCCVLACGMDGLKMDFSMLPTKPIVFLLPDLDFFEGLNDAVDTCDAAEDTLGPLLSLDVMYDVLQAETLAQILTQFFGDIRNVPLHVVFH